MGAGHPQSARVEISEGMGQVLAQRKYLQNVVSEISTALKGSAAR
jgi:hypothetical protein